MIPARQLLSLASSALAEYVFPPPLSSAPQPDISAGLHVLTKRAEKHDPGFIVSACLIPVLVILSGIFAGLTLGYMSLDETQLNVLSISGTPKQKEYANKIKPIRQNGHLLLVTLLLANMIVNETLPVISDPVLGGGVVSVVVSTILIVLFAEIIPQSICTRHGLYVGAKMAGPTRILMYVLWIVAWPVAKLLEFILGSHHGIIYRRAELKELIAMHSSVSPHGGDLRSDTVTIIGATLDLQEKVVRQAMTPIADVFMLSIDARLDYETLRRICQTGHSRVPVYEEVEVSVPTALPGTKSKKGVADAEKMKVKKIVGILLVKQCMLLDPQDAVPVRKMQLNKVPFVPQNEPLLGILNRFQEGRSHMAIVSRMSVERAQSVKKAVKKGLTQRLRDSVMGDSSDSSDSEDDKGLDTEKESVNDHSTVDGETVVEKRGRKKQKKAKRDDLEMGSIGVEAERARREAIPSLPKALEQSMPADAVLTKESAEEYLRTQGIDPAIMPLGIITLEDVLEELIGEEIYDEFDAEGAAPQPYIPPEPQHRRVVRKNSAPGSVPVRYARLSAPPTPEIHQPIPVVAQKTTSMPRPLTLSSLRSPWFLRSKSAPPTPRRSTDEPLPQPPVPVPMVTVTASVPSTSPENGVLLAQIKENNLSQKDGSSSGGAETDFIHVPSSAPVSSPPTPMPTSSVMPLTSAAASLEAVLLDRKRRHIHGVPSPLATPTTGLEVGLRKVPGIGGGKGKGFKSSPLNDAGAE